MSENNDKDIEDLCFFGITSEERITRLIVSNWDTEGNVNSPSQRRRSNETQQNSKISSPSKKKVDKNLEPGFKSTSGENNSPKHSKLVSTGEENAQIHESEMNTGESDTTGMDTATGKDDEGTSKQKEVTVKPVNTVSDPESDRTSQIRNDSAGVASDLQQVYNRDSQLSLVEKIRPEHLNDQLTTTGRIFNDIISFEHETISTIKKLLGEEAYMGRLSTRQPLVSVENAFPRKETFHDYLKKEKISKKKSSEEKEITSSSGKSTKEVTALNEDKMIPAEHETTDLQRAPEKEQQIVPGATVSPGKSPTMGSSKNMRNEVENFLDKVFASKLVTGATISPEPFEYRTTPLPDEMFTLNDFANLSKASYNELEVKEPSTEPGGSVVDTTPSKELGTITLPNGNGNLESGSQCEISLKTCVKDNPSSGEDDYNANDMPNRKELNNIPGAHENQQSMIQAPVKAFSKELRQNLTEWMEKMGELIRNSADWIEKQKKLKKDIDEQIKKSRLIDKMLEDQIEEPKILTENSEKLQTDVESIENTKELIDKRRLESSSGLGKRGTTFVLDRPTGICVSGGEETLTNEEDIVQTPAKAFAKEVCIQKSEEIDKNLVEWIETIDELSTDSEKRIDKHKELTINPEEMDKESRKLAQNLDKVGGLSKSPSKAPSIELESGTLSTTELEKLETISLSKQPLAKSAAIPFSDKDGHLESGSESDVSNRTFVLEGPTDIYCSGAEDDDNTSDTSNNEELTNIPEACSNEQDIQAPTKVLSEEECVRSSDKIDKNLAEGIQTMIKLTTTKQIDDSRKLTSNSEGQIEQATENLGEQIGKPEEPTKNSVESEVVAVSNDQFTVPGPANVESIKNVAKMVDELIHNALETALIKKSKTLTGKLEQQIGKQQKLAINLEEKIEKQQVSIQKSVEPEVATLSIQKLVDDVLATASIKESGNVDLSEESVIELKTKAHIKKFSLEPGATALTISSREHAIVTVPLPDKDGYLERISESDRSDRTLTLDGPTDIYCSSSGDDFNVSDIFNIRARKNEPDINQAPTKAFSGEECIKNQDEIHKNLVEWIDTVEKLSTTTKRIDDSRELSLNSKQIEESRKLTKNSGEQVKKSEKSTQNVVEHGVLQGGPTDTYSSGSVGDLDSELKTTPILEEMFAISQISNLLKKSDCERDVEVGVQKNFREPGVLTTTPSKKIEAKAPSKQPFEKSAVTPFSDKDVSADNGNKSNNAGDKLDTSEEFKNRQASFQTLLLKKCIKKSEELNEDLTKWIKEMQKTSENIKERIDRSKKLTGHLEQLSDISKEWIENPEESIENPEESIENPEGLIKNPEESIDNPEESIESLEESIENPEESIGNPEESIENREESIENSEESIDNPEESIENLEESIENTEESIENPEESIENPEEPIENPEESIENPEDLIENPEEWIENPEEWIENPEKWNENPEERNDVPDERTGRVVERTGRVVEWSDHSDEWTDCSSEWSDYSEEWTEYSDEWSDYSEEWTEYSGEWTDFESGKPDGKSKKNDVTFIHDGSCDVKETNEADQDDSYNLEEIDSQENYAQTEKATDISQYDDLSLQSSSKDTLDDISSGIFSPTKQMHGKCSTSWLLIEESGAIGTTTPADASSLKSSSQITLDSGIFIGESQSIERGVADLSCEATYISHDDANNFESTSQNSLNDISCKESQASERSVNLLPGVTDIDQADDNNLKSLSNVVSASNSPREAITISQPNENDLKSTSQNTPDEVSSDGIFSGESQSNGKCTAILSPRATDIVQTDANNLKNISQDILDEVSSEDIFSGESQSYENGVTSLPPRVTDTDQTDDKSLKSFSQDTLDEVSSEDIFSGESQSKENGAARPPPRVTDIDQGNDNNFKSVSQNTLDEVSSDGIYSGETPSSEEGAVGLSPGEEKYCEEEKEFLYDITFERKCRLIEKRLLIQAFRGLKLWESDLPEEIARNPKKKNSEERKIARGGVFTPYSNLKTSQHSEPQKTAVAPKPTTHCAVVLIEKIEKLLEMVLTLGYKLNSKEPDRYGQQELPIPVHNVMCDVRTFLEPIKSKLLENPAQSEYFRGFVSPLEKSFEPVLNYLKDNIAVLQTPENSIAFVQLPRTEQGRTRRPGDPYSNFCFRRRSQPNAARPMINPLTNYFYDPTESRSFSPGIHPKVHSWGLIEIPLLQDITVVLTLNMGILMYNRRNKSFIALSADGQLAGIKFNFGEFYYAQGATDITCINMNNTDIKRVKMAERGIRFQHVNSPTVYLVEAFSVTSSCHQLATRITSDFIGRVFYSGSTHGQQYVADCCDMLRFARYEVDSDGSVVWIINNIKIKQTTDGQVVLHKCNAETTLIMDPTSRDLEDKEEIYGFSGRLSTSKIHATFAVSKRPRGTKYKFYVKQGTMRMFNTDDSFIVRNAGQAAGIDEDNEVFLRRGF